MRLCSEAGMCHRAGISRVATGPVLLAFQAQLILVQHFHSIQAQSKFSRTLSRSVLHCKLPELELKAAVLASQTSLFHWPGHKSVPVWPDEPTASRPCTDVHSMQAGRQECSNWSACAEQEEPSVVSGLDRTDSARTC